MSKRSKSSAQKPAPKYRLHRQSGQAIVTLPDLAGRRRDVILGPHGSKASKALYDEEIAKWRAAGGDRRPRTSRGGATIADIVLEFKKHAEIYYRHPDGRLTSEVSVYRRAVHELVELFGDEPANQFDAGKLEQVQLQMIDNKVSRKVINKFITKIRNVFRWATKRKMVPVWVFSDLCTLEGLKPGRTLARERKPIQPVRDEHVDAIFDYVNPSIRAMIELQRLTGMRPGEVCSMRSIDIKKETIQRPNQKPMTAILYRPGRHKNSWRGPGHERVIVLGQRAYDIVRSFLSANLEAPLFSPRIEREHRYLKLRANRETKVPPSQINRRRENPQRLPRHEYTKDSYARAIKRAIKAANEAAEAAAEKAGDKLSINDIVPHWHPNQLRHSFATRSRYLFGLEATQVALGHKSADTTQIYAEADIVAAVNIANQVG